jgi:uncharacterized UBP type Zn finger protein
LDYRSFNKKSTESGHYTSFIKLRDLEIKEKYYWFLFDDNNVGTKVTLGKSITSHNVIGLIYILKNS